jgi:hypothetical protein
MIETEQRIVFGSHVIDIGKGQEYGSVRVSISNSAFKVSVFGEFGHFIKEDVYPIKRNLTAEEIAFMEAYTRSVGDADSNYVEAYLRAEDDRQFCDEYGNEYYTGLADAHGVWREALAFAKDPAYYAKKEDDNYILIS